ncbi:MAG TPA: heme exporter protein CcmB [Bryobacteraceae bacterium]|nr:heme exporter protein CcmB [Bryobacteraceae bacterium]
MSSELRTAEAGAAVRIEPRARPRTSLLAKIWTITAKDLRSEMRTKEALNASIAFSLVILVLFSFAFDPSSDQFQEFSGGLLWLVFSFAGALVLNRSFARETQNDCLDGLLAAPIPAAALFLGKAFANFALLIAVEVVSIPVFGLFYDVHWAGQFGELALVTLLGTWALTVIGTFFSALTVNLRMRELMLPTLVYPLMIPALMAAMKLTTDLLAGTPINAENVFGLKLLAGFDFIFTLLSLVMIDTVLVG